MTQAHSEMAVSVNPHAEGRLRTLLIGSGSLGRGFLKYLRDHGGPAELVGVVTSRHGRFLAPEGADPKQALYKVESTEGLGSDGPEEFEEILEHTKPQVIVECIPQNVRSGEPALGYLRLALDRGIHVVTANKAAIALGYRDLQHRAAKANVQFRFEATVLDALPVFSTISQLRDSEVSHVRAVLNGTSSLVLESVQLGSTRSRGLARAQAQGIAEADAVLDLDGWDAAAKAALLSNVWMGGALRVVDVVRTGCDVLKDEQLRESENVHWRLLADITRGEDGGIKAKVEPTALEPEDPFFALRGGNGGVTIELRDGPKFTMLQDSHGLDDAAFAMVRDLRAILAGEPQL